MVAVSPSSCGAQSLLTVSSCNTHALADFQKAYQAIILNRAKRQTTFGKALPLRLLIPAPWGSITMLTCCQQFGSTGLVISVSVLTDCLHDLFLHMVTPDPCFISFICYLGLDASASATYHSRSQYAVGCTASAAKLLSFVPSGLDKIGAPWA